MSANSTRWVFVDDSSPLIQYRGPWYQSTDSLADSGVSGPIYQGSQRGVNDTASFTFSFSGTDISAFGTSAVTRDVSSTRIDPQWACVVDSTAIAYISPSQQPQNQFPLCKSAPMADERHNLTVVVSSTGGTPFWFDFLTVRLSPTSTDIPHPAVFYSSSDPAVQYAVGQWTTLPENAGMLTQQVGSTMFLSFNGTKLTWYGRMISGYPSGPSTGTYSIDGGAPVSFTINGLLFDWTTRYQQIVFETPDFPMGKHNITVKYLGASTPLVLEYLVVQDGDLVFTGNDARPPVPEVDSHHPPKKGIIIGAALGAIALLALLGIIIFLLRKLKQRRRVKWLSGIDEGPPNSEPMPPKYMVEATPFMSASNNPTPTNSPPATPSPFASAGFTDGILSHPASHTSASAMQHMSISSFGSDQKVRMSHLSGMSSSSTAPLAGRSSFALYDASTGANYTHMQLSSSLGVGSSAFTGAPARPPLLGRTSDEKVRMEYEQGVAVNRPLTLMNASSESPAPVTLVHHEDSGLRMTPNSQGVPAVLLDVPPSYTPR